MSSRFVGWTKPVFCLAVGVALLTWILATIASKTSTGRVLTQTEEHWFNDSKIAALLSISLATGLSAGLFQP